MPAIAPKAAKLYCTFPILHRSLSQIRSIIPSINLSVRDGHDFRLLSKIHLESITGARGTIQDISFTADESQFAVLIDDTYWDGQRGNIVNKKHLCLRYR
ncbi:MAG: hypothetical protein R2865_08055 [Deinococcales bacterium]